MAGECRLPRAGDTTLDLRIAHGVPIYAKSLFWDGNGEVSDASARIRTMWHTDDHLALGAGIAAITFFTGGQDIYAGEAEAVGRCYAYRGEAAGVFAEATGGYLQSTDPVPPGGTEWNFTFSFAAGLEIPWSGARNLELGITYHHLSNALGRMNDRNPSQNEAQFWLGVGLRF